MRNPKLKKKLWDGHLWNPCYYWEESDSVPLITLEAQVHADPQTEAILEDAMFCATRVYSILKELPGAEGFYRMSVRLTRDEVRQAYGSFFALKRK